MTAGLLSFGRAFVGLPSGFNVLPLGAGGFVTGIDFALDGTKVCKTDVAGAYVWPAGGSQWNQIVNYNSMSHQLGFAGVWEIRVAPSLSTKLYMITGPNNTQTVYVSTDQGATWTATNCTMTNGRADGQFNNRLTNQKLAIDPNNSNVVYMGMPNGSTPNTGVWRCTDGSTFSQVAAITGVSNEDPGTAGIVFDASYGTTSTGLGGITRSSRVLVPVGGVGIYESTDGGVTFSLASSDPTPSTTISYTTSIANSVIIVQALCYCDGAVTGVTNTASGGGTSGLTWHLRAGPQTNTYNYAALYEYYAVAPTAGTYAITVAYGDGRFGVIAGSVTNQVGVFAVTGVDVSSPPTSIFDSGGPRTSILNGGSAPTLTTTNANDLVFSFVTAVGATDSGYTALNTSVPNAFWSEYKIVSSATGYNPGAIVHTGYGIITDAIKQSGGGTLALDGTPQYANSGPSSQTGPVDITTAQIDYSGTYWAVNGPTERTAGGVWRYTRAGVWKRMDNGVNGAAAAGQPSANSQGNCVCVDPRQGHEGRVTTWPNHTYWAYQTADGNSTSPTWVGSTGGGSPIVTSPVVGWQTGAGLTAMADMLIDPTDGTYWNANGLGVQKFLTDLDYNSGAYKVNPIWHSEGMEELNATDALMPPGGSQLLVGVQDRCVMFGSPPGYPSAYWKTGYDSHVFDMDYASDNPNYVVAYIKATLPAQNTTAYSLNYGVSGSWVDMVTVPTTTVLGGNIAAASATDSTHANLVCIPSCNTIAPVYTIDNGSGANGGWQTCSGIPSEAYWKTNLNQRNKSLAADRVNIGTFYAFCVGYNSGTNYGLYKSIDNGATWTKQSPGPSLSIGANGSTLYSTPGFAGHLWLANSQYRDSRSTIIHSEDGGANWTVISNVDQVLGLGIGKASPSASPSNYPTLFLFGNLSGVKGFYYSIDKGTTWSSLGGVYWAGLISSYGVEGYRSIMPVTTQDDSILGIRGDWNTFGRMYGVMYSSGAFYYTP